MPSRFAQIFSSKNSVKKPFDNDTYSVSTSEGRDSASIYYYVPKAEQKRADRTGSQVKPVAGRRAFISPASLMPVLPFSRI